MKKLLRTGLVLLGAEFFLIGGSTFASTTAILVPVSDGNYKQFTPSTGSTHYTLVDESACNGTTDYNYTSTVGYRDSYGIDISSVGNGASISQVDITPCASRNSSTSGTASSSVFYRWNGSNSADTGNYSLSGTTPVQLATSTYASLNLFKTSTSTFEIGAAYSSGTRGMRLSRIATRLTYTLTSPSGPTNLSASNISSTQNNLSWTDNSNNELMFRIYRSTDSATAYSIVATTTWNVVSFANTGLSADHTYLYKVSAYNSAGEATSSAAYTITYNNAPSAPSSLSATSVGSDVVLSWADNSLNEDVFQIERSIDNINFSQIATTTLNFASTTSWTDIGAGSGSYYYRVRAKNVIGNSSYSNTAQYNIPTGPDTVYVSGTISSDTAWTPNHVYVITSNLTINSGVTLTVQAGVVAKFDPSNFPLLTVAGTINAQGTSTGTIYFTSLYDDTVPAGYGDTNGDGSATTPAAGNWDSIQINSGGSATFNHTMVSYGGKYGGGRSYANLYLNGGSLTVGDSEIATSTDYGIYQSSGTLNVTGSDIHGSSLGVWSNGGDATISSNHFFNGNSGVHAGGSSMVMTDNTFTGMAWRAASMGTSLGSFTHSGNTSSGSPKNGIIYSGTPSVDQTLSGNDLPYILTGNLAINAGITLTLQPGAIIKFQPDAYPLLTVSGTLNAQGSPTGTIYFTSLYDDVGGDTNSDGSATTPAGGDWNSIQINTGGSASFQNSTVRYGGKYGGGNSYADLYLNGGTLTVEDSEIGPGTDYGIYQSSGSSSIYDSSIHNVGTGIYATGGSIWLQNPSYSNNTNDFYIGPNVTGGQYVPPVLEQDDTWTSTTILPYLIGVDGLTVTAGTTLTIDPGTVVKLMATSSKITVNGTLRAIGNSTATGTIYFTSYKDDSVGGDTNGDGASNGSAGDWDAIQSNSGSSSTIAYANIRYGGYHPVGVDGVELYIVAGNVTANNVDIATGTTFGVIQAAGLATLSGADIHGHENGLTIGGGTMSVTSYSAIHDNSNDGIYVTGGTLAVNSSSVYNQSNNYGIYINGGDTNVYAADIHHNNYGIWNQLDSYDIIVSESAIHDNTHGIENNGSSVFTDLLAQNSWWGNETGPSGYGPGSGDSVSNHVIYETWHHNDDWSLVNQNYGLVWSSTSTLMSDLNVAMSRWNDTASSMGLISMTSSTERFSADVTIDNTPTSNPIVLGNTIGRPTKTIQLFNDNIDATRISRDLCCGDGLQYEQWVPLHELGHALGLGHVSTDDEYSDVMYFADRSIVNFGSDDKKDYNFYWQVVRWAALSFLR
jgi:fibronectin type 3 domain-containing protein